MQHRFLVAVLALAAATALAPGLAVAQSQSAAPSPAPGFDTALVEADASGADWSLGRTAWGDPDLQGIWNNVTATRLERPADFADRAELTAEESAQFSAGLAEQRAEREAQPHTGYAASIWFESSDLLAGNRTSLLVDPPDGRLPPLTSVAARMAEVVAEARRASPADTWWDRGPYERCVSRGLPGAMMPGFYNHNYQILQTPSHVVILVEMIHDARIIPMDGRDHVDGGIRQWLGDSRGRWEGDTLVVETTNLPHVDQRGVAVFGTSEQGRVIERFTRIDENTMDYRVTVDDPATFTAEWTASIPMRRIEGPIFEYACHEGNYGLTNILAGHRREEAEAAAALAGSR